MFQNVKIPTSEEIGISRETQDDLMDYECESDVQPHETSCSAESNGVSACANEFIKLVKEGKFLAEAKENIVNKSIFPKDTVEVVEGRIK